MTIIAIKDSLLYKKLLEDTKEWVWVVPTGVYQISHWLMSNLMFITILDQVF